MKSIIKFIFVFAFVVMCGSSYAQDYPKRSIEGHDYYVYIVEPGNTLFGIARAFSAEVKAVKKANPNAAEGLEIGQEVLIPLASIDRREAKRSDVRTDGDYLLHTVQRKETLFSIARIYGVSVSDIVELNPDAAQSLSTGLELTIPVQRSTSVKEAYLEPARNDTFMVHRVLQGETAYGIARLYELPLDSLLNANGLANDGLEPGAWLVVPKYNEAFQQKLDEREAIESARNPYPMPTGRKDQYNISILLPFEIQHNDSLVQTLMQGKNLNVITDIALEFYRGAHIALDSLEKLGLRANVNILDLGDDLVGAKDMLKTKAIKESHLIIGPMHKSSLAVVSEFSRGQQKYLVSPNSFSNEVFGENPYLFRASASRETMLKYLANFVAINHRMHNVLMVSSEAAKDWPERKLFKQYYNQALGTFPNAFRDSIASMTRNSVREDRIESFLRKDTLNVLVIPSNDPAFISDFITRLLPLQGSGYRVQVYGLDQWVRFDNIEAAYKNRFKLRLVVANYVDYTNPHVTDFLSKFRDRYHTEPGVRGYGFQGFDLTMYFGLALLNEGLSFGSRVDGMSVEGTMGNYRFGRTSTGVDFENKSVLIIEYDDYEIKRVN
jgi:LysM repeat protein